MELHGSLRRIPIGSGKRDNHHVPLRRDLAKRENRSRSTVSGPVTDQLVSVGRSTPGHGRDLWLRAHGAAAGSSTACRARCRCNRKGRRVGEAENVAEAFNGACVPGQQCNVLQVIRGSCHLSEKGFRLGNVVLRVRVGRLEKEVGAGDTSAATASLITWALRRGSRPRGKHISRTLRVASTMDQRIVQRIFDKLRKLLREGLHIIVFDDAWGGMKIRRQDERGAGGGINPMRAPGTTHSSVAESVKSGVVCDREHELTLQFRKLLEQLVLKKFDVDDGERTAGHFRCEYVSEADRN